MERFKDFASQVTTKIGLTSSGETFQPGSTATGTDQSMGHPEPSSDILQSRSQSESHPHHSPKESLSHNQKGSDEPLVGGNANASHKEERCISTNQQWESREVTKLRQDLDEMNLYANCYKCEAADYKSERDSLRTDCDHAHRELGKARKREEALRRENTELRSLLETRRQELQDAQRFMGTADMFAESEVVQETRNLNTEIFNLAQSIAGRATPDKDQKRRRGGAEVLHVLGPSLVAVLESTNIQGDTVLLEIAVQAATTAYLAHVISTWTTQDDHDAILSSIYEKIRSSANQSVTGQWRSLTRKFAQSEQLDVWLSEDGSKHVLIMLLQQAAALSGMQLPPESSLEQQMQILISKAIRIRHLVGEAMTGSEYDVYLPHAGALFVAEEMEDAYDPEGNGRRTGLQVLCRVSLGLRRVEKVEGELRSVTLAKPGVGLQTLLEDLEIANGDDARMAT